MLAEIDIPLLFTTSSPLYMYNRWLKAMFATSHLMIQEYGSSKIVHYLESAARTGVPLMITVSFLFLLHCSISSHTTVLCVL